MNKTQLLEALASLNDDSVIGARFTFDNGYSYNVECQITNIIITINADTTKTTTICVAKANRDDDLFSQDSIAAFPLMSKQALVYALTLNQTEDSVLQAKYLYDTGRYSYPADITSVELTFDSNGIQAKLMLKEHVVEEEAAA